MELRLEIEKATPQELARGIVAAEAAFARRHHGFAGAGWHSTIFLSRLTQSERGAFEIVASKLIRELLDGCLNRPIKQVEVVKAFEAALDVAASDELRYGGDSA